MSTKVLHLRSISYTGTTWINLVLGSTDNAFPIGPPDRFFDIYEEHPERLCLVHGPECDFWPKFAANFNPRQPFFAQLGESSGKDLIVTNNSIPTKMGKELKKRGVTTSEAIVVRDGRAVVASYARKFPDGGVQGAIDWYRPAAEGMLALAKSSGLPILKYEDFVDQADGFWERTSEALNMPLTRDCLDYYKFDHHPVMGNQGTLALYRRYQGKPIPNFGGSEFYEAAFESGSELSSTPVRDDRWMSELDAPAMALFEAECGPTNRELGYA